MDYKVHTTPKNVLKYRTVPTSWRSAVEKRDLKNRKLRSVESPIVKELLEGKTLLIIPENIKKHSGRVQRPFVTGMYGVAKTHGRRLRVHYFANIDNEEYGYLVWMEKAS